MDIFEKVSDRISAEGWLVLQDFVEPAVVASLREECRQLEASGEFREAAIGNNANRRILQDVRGDDIRWLDADQGSEARQYCMARFEHLRLEINRRLQMGLFDFECHYARYAPGAFYGRHFDRFHGDTRRILSSVLYLNDAWKNDDGGALRLYMDADAAGHVDVTPTGGTLVLFLSERFAHEVLPARRERLSLTGWFLGRR